jgi:hypothetical protein
MKNCAQIPSAARARYLESLRTSQSSTFRATNDTARILGADTSLKFTRQYAYGHREMMMPALVVRIHMLKRMVSEPARLFSPGFEGHVSWAHESGCLHIILICFYIVDWIS